MGTHRDTGAAITGLEDVMQSTGEILRTPQRSRPLSPGFGLGYQQMQDASMGPSGRARLTTGVMTAIGTYERRAKVKRVRLAVDETGLVETTVDITTAVDGAVSVPIRASGATLRAQLRDPLLYYPIGGYDEGTGTWTPSLGEGDMTAPLAAPELFGPFPILLPGAHLATPETPLSSDTTWTVGVVVWPVVPDATSLVASLIVDGEPFPWAALRGTNTVELLGLHPVDGLIVDETLGDITAAPYSVVWLWGWPGQLGGAVGFEGAAHPLPGVVAAASQLLVGPTAGTASMAVGQVGIWERVLTRRERLAIAALWMREVSSL